jgi:hypothetical protein
MTTEVRSIIQHARPWRMSAYIITADHLKIGGEWGLLDEDCLSCVLAVSAPESGRGSHRNLETRQNYTEIKNDIEQPQLDAWHRKQNIFSR